MQHSPKTTSNSVRDTSNYSTLCNFCNMFKKDKTIPFDQKEHDKIYSKVFDRLISLQDLVQQSFQESGLKKIVKLYKQHYDIFTNYNPQAKGTQHFWTMVSHIPLSKTKNLRLLLDIIVKNKEDLFLVEDSKGKIIRILNDYLCQRSLIYSQLQKVVFVSSPDDFQALLSAS